jgi:hypothetical protein
MANLWDVTGDNIDRAYQNLCSARSRIEREIRQVLASMWSVYEPYADLDFRQGFARDPEARFWEMYVGTRLLEAGKTLLLTANRPRVGGQPDICVIDGARRIWIEAIVPDVGSPGPDQVRRPVPLNEGGGVSLAPKRQIQLRTTSALLTKTRVVEDYLGTGIIEPNDVRLVAIGVGRFGIYASEEPPTILSAVFPIGEYFVSIDRETLQVVNQGFQSSFHIERQGGEVSRTAFLSQRYASISGAIWSRISIGNMSRVERPLTLVHNPVATVRMQEASRAIPFLVSPEAIQEIDDAELKWPKNDPRYRIIMEERFAAARTERRSSQN